MKNCNLNLYKKKRDSSETLTLSPSTEFDFPLIFPFWSVLSEDFVGFDVRFYDAEDDGAKPKPFLFERLGCSWDIDTPLKFVVENDQAVFNLYYTRLKCACAAYIRFRVFDCVRGDYERGECWASGSIKAKLILGNGESGTAMLSVFES